MVILVPPDVSRHRIVDILAHEGIGTSVHFRPVHHFKGMRGRFQVATSLAVCDELAERALSLPLHARMTCADVDRVVSTLADALSRAEQGAQPRESA
jgi:dTDP-4-amino-4,6-dideoxygalactose transaminase